MIFSIRDGVFFFIQIQFKKITFQNFTFVVIAGVADVWGERVEGSRGGGAGEAQDHLRRQHHSPAGARPAQTGHAA